MTGRVVQLDTDAHRAAQALLPWYASGRLDAADLAQVQAHLGHCARCQADLEWERQLIAAQAGRVNAGADTGTGADGSGDVDLDLARLHRRIAGDRTGRGLAGIAARVSRAWRAAASGLRWAVLAQAGAIAGLVAALVVVLLAPPEAYHALGGGGAARSVDANVVVRFRGDATEAAIRAALRASGARLVDGPTATDAYLLSLPAGHEAAARASLRAAPVVLLAESLDAGPRP